MKNITGYYRIVIFYTLETQKTGYFSKEYLPDITGKVRKLDF